MALREKGGGTSGCTSYLSKLLCPPKWLQREKRLKGTLSSITLYTTKLTVTVQTTYAAYHKSTKERYFMCRASMPIALEIVRQLRVVSAIGHWNKFCFIYLRRDRFWMRNGMGRAVDLSRRGIRQGEQRPRLGGEQMRRGR